MKGIVLCAVLVTLLIHGFVLVAPNKPELQCYYCKTPVACKTRNTTKCKPDQTLCLRTYRNITDPSGDENKNNYYANTTENVLVWSRDCSTQKTCDSMKKKKLTTTTCCASPLCNP